MKQPSFPVFWPKLALILFLLPSCSASEECSVENINSQENSSKIINDNFECVEKRLSDIDKKLEQILSRLSEKPGNGSTGVTNGDDESDRWSVMIGSAKIRVTKATLKKLPNGRIQMVAEWRIRNRSDKDIMIMMSYGKYSTMRSTGDKGRYANMDGMSICNQAEDVCGSWDSSRWTIIPSGQRHGFSTSVVGRGVKMNVSSLSINARFIINEQGKVMVKDVSFADIPL